MSMLNRNFARRVSLLSRPSRGVLGMRGFSSVGFWRTIFFFEGGGDIGGGKRRRGGPWSSSCVRFHVLSSNRPTLNLCIYVLYN
jgi:hypothetical protein